MFKTVIDFLENSSWLANFLTIFLGIGTILGTIYGGYKLIKVHLSKLNDYSNVYNYVLDKRTKKDKDHLKDRKINGTDLSC